MSLDPSPCSKTELLSLRQVSEVLLVEKPRHLVEEKEDLERLFPRCPPNTLESAAKQSKKSKRRSSSGNNNININNNNSESVNIDPQTEKVPQVAKIIDLDFNSNNDEEVNEQNRRYHQQLSSQGGTVGVLSPTTSESTKSTPAKNLDKSVVVDMSTTCSSASSTASTKGSSSDGGDSLSKARKSHLGHHQGNGTRVASRNYAPENEMQSMTVVPPGGLRDTKIEIAGGREVYHQSRVRSGRHKHGSKQQQRHSGDFSQHSSSIIQPEETSSVSNRRSTGYIYETHFSEQAERRVSKPRPPPAAAPATRSFIKETVFSSEIHSIEYPDTAAGVLSTSPGRRRNLIYETDLGTTSEVVFDDIGEMSHDPTSIGSGNCDVNVTYDLLQGEFPPPSLGGLIVKAEDDEDLLSLQTPLPLDGAHSSVGQSLDNLCLGAEANYGAENYPCVTEKSDPNPGANSRVIGGITIAEYDGSPRRYRPRGSNETASNASSSSDASKTSTVRGSGVKSVNRQGRQQGMRLPGFPQRVLPPAPDGQDTPSITSSPVAVKKEVTDSAAVVSNQVEEEELLKFDDIPPTATPATEAISKSTRIVTPQSMGDLSPLAPKVKRVSGGDDFDMRYEFSETRKVLEEFFPPAGKNATNTEDQQIPLKDLEKDFNELEYTLRRRSPLSHEPGGSSYVGQRLAADEGPDALASPCSTHSDLIGGIISNQDLLSMCTMTEKPEEEKGLTGLTTMVGQTRLNVEPAPICPDDDEDLRTSCIHPSTSIPTSSTPNVAVQNDFTLSPEMTDCDSADLESEMSINEGSYHSSGPRMHTSMPVLEDGLSSGHASDLEDDIIYSSSGSVLLKKQQQQQVPSTTQNIQNILYGSQKRPATTTTTSSSIENGGTPNKNGKSRVQQSQDGTAQLSSAARRLHHHKTASPQSPSTQGSRPSHPQTGSQRTTIETDLPTGTSPTSGDSTVDPTSNSSADPASVAAALKDIKMAIQATRVLQHQTRIPVQSSPSNHLRNSGQPLPAVVSTSAVAVSLPATPATNHHPPDDPWVRQTTSLRSTSINSVTTLTSNVNQLSSTVALNLNSSKSEVTSLVAATVSVSTVAAPSTTSTVANQTNDDSICVNATLDEDDEDIEEGDEENDLEEEEEEESESEIGEERVPTPKTSKDVDEDLDTDQETDRLLGQQYNDDNGYYDSKNEVAKKKGTKTKEAVTDPKVLIEGVLFRARYLGSTQLVCEGQPTKATRMMQAEEAVSRIKAPEGDSQPSTEVDLFISTEKIMVLNTDLKEIMMDHALRTISYIADIGDLLVIMARRRPAPTDDVQVIGTTPKMICHVFESEEAQFIAQSIGQAFQVAYVEFLKANGIEDSSFVKEMDYQEVLNSQEIFNNELALFSSKERQKEVVVPKSKGEILGVVIVESGWGSMLPTIVLANLAPGGPAARCGQLNIGDQVIAINGISLVGLPLSTCQHYIKNAKNKTAVKLTAVSCAPVVEVKIKRPDTKYQLGFSVQNGVICSLLRGGIAERGGVRVGHRIIEINGQSVVAVPHEKIVNLLATSVGEITMKTMPTSMFRLLTGQETPLYI